MSNQNLNNLKNVDGDNKLTIENLIEFMKNDLDGFLIAINNNTEFREKFKMILPSINNAHVNLLSSYVDNTSTINPITGTLSLKEGSTAALFATYLWSNRNSYMLNNYSEMLSFEKWKKNQEEEKEEKKQKDEFKNKADAYDKDVFSRIEYARNERLTAYMRYLYKQDAEKVMVELVSAIGVLTKKDENGKNYYETNKADALVNGEETKTASHLLETKWFKELKKQDGGAAANILELFIKNGLLDKEERLDEFVDAFMPLVERMYGKGVNRKDVLSNLAKISSGNASPQVMDEFITVIKQFPAILASNPDIRKVYEELISVNEVQSRNEMINRNENLKKQQELLNEVNNNGGIVIYDTLGRNKPIALTQEQYDNAPLDSNGNKDFSGFIDINIIDEVKFEVLTNEKFIQNVDNKMNEVNQRNNENNVMVKAVNESLDKIRNEVEKTNEYKNSEEQKSNRLKYKNNITIENEEIDNKIDNYNSNKIGF